MTQQAGREEVLYRGHPEASGKKTGTDTASDTDIGTDTEVPSYFTFIY